MGSEATNPWWPFFDLVVRTPRVELRPPTDEVLVQVAELAAAGIHDPEVMPFARPWTDQPLDELRRGTLQFGWRLRAELTPQRWTIPLAVWERRDRGELRLVGMQDLMADDFPTLRQVSSGSWLGREHQGRGLGAEMRAAVLHLAFAGLHAQVAHTDAWHDNHASIGVTTSLGYAPNGERLDRRRDRADRMLAFRLERDDWSRVRRDDIVISGLDGCLEVLGLR